MVRQRVVPISVFLTVIAALLTPALVSPSMATATATASIDTSVDSAMSELDTLDAEVADVVEVADQPDAYLNRWILGIDPDRVDLGLGIMAGDLEESLSDEVAQNLVAATLTELGHIVTDREAEMAYVVIETAPGTDEADLLAIAGVESVTRDIRLERALDGAMTAIRATDADLNTAIGGTRADGTGRIVVIIDDGIDRTHPFFGGSSTRVTKELCANREDCSNQKEGSGVAAHYSGDWHGTHVAGIAAGSGGPSGARRGVAQSGEIWAAKVFNPGGGASVVDINRALQWVYDLATASGSPHKVAAVNMSLGGMIGVNANCDSYSPTTTTRVKNLVDMGIAVVAAAGNSGSDNEIAWPACMSEVIAVGATNSVRDTPSITSFTNLSVALASEGLMAPGSSICSSIDQRLSADSDYFCASGTSMSSPMVAGAIALMSQVSASASPEVMRAALYDTATPTAAYLTRTYPRINVLPAIGQMGVPSGTLQVTLRDVTADVSNVSLSGSTVTVALSGHNGGAAAVSVSVIPPPSGVVQIPGLLPGNWQVAVSAAGYSPTSSAVDITDGLTTALTANVTAPTGSMTGTFATDPGATTFILTPTGANLWPSRTLELTPAGTSFTLPNIRVGEWILQAAAGVSVSAAVPVTVVANTAAPVGELSLIAPIGTIQLDLLNGFDGSAFTGSAQVVATPIGAPEGRVVRSVTEEGSSASRINFSQLVAGDWSLAISGTNFQSTVSVVTVTQNQTTPVTVSLTPVPRDVSGVADLPGAAGVTSETEEFGQTSPVPMVRAALVTREFAPLESEGVIGPLSGIGQITFDLVASGGGGETIRRTGNLNDSGSYRVSEVPAGNWQVTVTTFGYTTDSALPLVVAPGETSVEFNFSMRPVAQSSGLSRTSGSTSGGESVTINGIHFLPVTDFEASTGVDEVRFGGVSSSSPTIASDGRSLTVNAPARSAGTVQVQAFRNGTAVTGSFSYTYIAPSVDGGDSGGGGGGGGGGGSSNTGEVVNVALPAPVGGVATVPVSVPAGELRLGFQGLTGAGELRVEPRSDAPATGATGVTLIGGHLEITLTGANFREVELCIPYRTEDLAAAGVTTADLRLVHFVGSQGRTDITTRIDTAERKVCGRATSFSPFGIGVYQTQRIAGSDRYQTAVQISAAQFSPGVPVVYLANGLQFPDALSAAAAAAREGGPVLLTDPTRLPTVVRNELIRLRPARIVVVGGNAAVRAEVEQAVRTAVPSATVQRRQGPDRYQTAAAISRAVFPAGVNKVYLATGLTFPDALAGAAAAGRDGAPVLLVPGTGGAAGVPEAVATELARLNPSEVIILGGTAAISAVVSTRVGQILPQAVRTRVEGRDRYETASRLAVSCAGARVYAATGVQFADALAGAVAAGRSGCPMLLIPPSGLTTAVRNRLSALKPGEIVVLGGSRAVSFSNESALANYLP